MASEEWTLWGKFGDDKPAIKLEIGSWTAVVGEYKARQHPPYVGLAITRQGEPYRYPGVPTNAGEAKRLETLLEHNRRVQAIQARID